MQRIGIMAIVVAVAFGAAECCRGADNWLQAAKASPVKKFDGVAQLQRKDSQQDRRDKVVVRRIKPQCFSDWDTDPTALPQLTYQTQERTRGELPMFLDNSGIELVGNEIFDYPIIYFTSHYPFTFSADEVDNLKKFLARGGSLWLDDCVGSGPFMDSVYPNVQRIVPGAEMMQMHSGSKEFGDFFRMVYNVPSLPDIDEMHTSPLQCALVNGRPAIIACPNDYGCGWEVSVPPTPMNPLGEPAHGWPAIIREGVFQLSINWLFYSLTH